MSFRLVPKLVTFNDLERRNGRYFALFQRIRVASVRAQKQMQRYRGDSKIAVLFCWDLTSLSALL